MTKHLLSSVGLFLSIAAFGQANYWTQTNNVISKQIKERKSQAAKQKLYSLDLNGLKTNLANAPQRFSSDETLVLKFPDADGKLRNYVVQEASVLAPELQAKFSDIRSYIGWEKGNSQNTIRFSVTPTDGINIMYFDGWKVSYLDTYTQDLSTYTVYKREDLAPNPEKFNCRFDEANDLDNGSDLSSSLKAPLVRDGKFRTYRLALSTTAEYSTFHVNRAGMSSGTVEQKKAAVLSGMVATMTRVNGVYEKTVSLTMVMVPNNDQLIFLTASDYPSGLTYSNSDGFAMLNQNQSVCDKVIGTANYDIGHVFSTGGGGVAQLGSPCGSGKARGVTGSGAPVNDAFDIDYVAHEMGHQFGAPHTFNATTSSCGGGNRNLPTAYEVGSGSTIMAYAGICGSANNVQAHSDPYFHNISVVNMYNFISRSSDCSAKTANNNGVPVVDAGLDYIIPQGTPFVLSGDATDPDGDSLTYLWEQMDNQDSTQPPVSTNTGGPTFRSYIPETSNKRYFPKMSYLLANNLKYKWEMVPTVARTLNFAFLANDNKSTGNQSGRDEMRVTVTADGPFKVTSQTSNVEYDAAEALTVTWDVAGTNAGTINTQNVQVLLSKDNGITFTTDLGVFPNNGAASVMLPNEDIISARIMIKAVDNIYFALNSSFFKVKKNLAVVDLAKKGFVVYPNPAKNEININLANKSVGADYIIYDQSGRLLKSGKVTSNDKVNVGELSAGTYRLVVTSNGTSHSQNLIIKK